MASAFKVGCVYRSYAELDSALKDYSKQVHANYYKDNSETLKVPIYTPSIIETFRYKRLYFKCKFAGAPRVKNTTKNERQTSSFKSGCLSSITVIYDRKIVGLVVKKLVETHNHARNSAIFECLQTQRSLQGDEKEFAIDALKVKGNKRLLQAQIKEKFGKTTTIRDLQNLSSAAKSGGNKAIDCTILEEIHGELVRFDGMTAEVMVSEENALEGIFIQDERMKKYFDRYPEVWMRRIS